ncbi:larval cuticle protein LCP-17 isoform X1 [Drosophila santomea]|uniref:larval cuticle protein LCP-17 isoform X1 n=1 Tax=Drosophila santomea TaxID=129105 RepID=UPI001952BE68|nr:larval cuticle protein LCP-17 isoform X1 [Drosophila santomea]XP_039487030.1 larval cuticle protein LCP-17 isoform X1 [Drosophila santomea]
MYIWCVCKRVSGCWTITGKQDDQQFQIHFIFGNINSRLPSLTVNSKSASHPDSSMFKTIIVFLALSMAVVLSAPVEHGSSTAQPPVAILESSHEKHEDGSYNFSYLGEDGTHRREEAVVRNQGTENEYLEISGSYSYFDANGQEVTVTYKADDHGFVPEGGAILPQISLAAKQVSEQVSQPDLDYDKPPKV